jgi:hypothetical protein
MVLPNILLKNAQILTIILKYSIGWSQPYTTLVGPPVGLITNSVIQR